MKEPRKISHEQVRAFLVAHHGLSRFAGKGKRALPALLNKLRCIQLDPLDCIGTNADLVAFARVEGLKRGDIYSGLLPGHAFEHFAKERCLLPASAFPWYRQRAREVPWWRLTERLKRLPEGILEPVLAEIRERGPVSVASLAPRGKVEAIDWSGWKGTSNANRMAVEVLWTRCQVVVCGKTRTSKLYDIPERALAAQSEVHEREFEPWALRERVQAAGLLTRASGPVWGMLTEARLSDLPDRLIEAGELEDVVVEGSPRRYLAPAGFLEQKLPKLDDKIRILGPLDPLIWDRGLIKLAFDFDYAWEVYKPEALRRWGWYVCPLLRGNSLIGRIEAVAAEGTLKVKKIWKEKNAKWDDALLDEALDRHARACGVERVVRPRSKKS